MDPKIAKRLMETVPEMEDFIVYLKATIKEVDSVFSMGEIPFSDIQVEVRARRLAIEKLVDIMKPLVNLQDFEPVNHKEFAVDVE